MARYMAADERSATPSSSYQLAGVLMLDGVSFTDPAQHIALIPDGPDGIPVYNLSSTRNPWNLFGTMDAALAQERPPRSTARRCSSAGTRMPWWAATR